jgi:DNA ligase-1
MMKQFSQLYASLDLSNKTNDKVQALVQYFREADDIDKLHTLALFTGKRPKRGVSTTLMRQWAIELANIPEWLFAECYSDVGDLGETIALTLPEPTQSIDLPLHQWIEELSALKQKTDDEKKEFVLSAWNGLPAQERFIFNKLIGGSFRIGVSAKLIIQALSLYAGIDKNIITHSIMGKWQMEDVNFEELIRGTYIQADNSKPYPFCLAYPIDTQPEELGAVSDWQAEYKWDGIRGQIVKRNGEIFIWSRGEELVTAQFPELEKACLLLPHDFVMDGEIIVVKNNEIQNFNELQKRLNRKNLTAKMLDELPVSFFIYDIMEYDGTDLRNEPLTFRRDLLEKLFPADNDIFRLSQVIDCTSWAELHLLREQSRNLQSEGLMLKRKESFYHAGRKRGDWWKWKVDPLTIDAVLIYAQKGSGRRSSQYTDFTFAIKKDEELVTIAKAYSGLTDKEITEINAFIRHNSLEKFGPVRTVKPQLVFEIAFEGIGYSPRHKAGIALRFPRIVRWRRDKTIADIDTIDTVKSLIR